MRRVGALAPALFAVREWSPTISAGSGFEGPPPGGFDMKATIERATLLRGLSHVQSVVERRNTIPILSNVLIEAQGGGADEVSVAAGPGRHLRNA